jgi:L-asparaginase II
MRFRLEVLVRRGSITEARHRVEAAVCDARGGLRAGTEHPDGVTAFRSAAKPFQLLPLVERGHADRWGFGDEQLAVMAASHTGSVHHLELVRGILARIGLSERELRCGFHEPLDAASQAHLKAHPEARSPVYNNCSGKHAGMLALALAEGWPPADYQRGDHPVQRLMRVTVAELCGRAADELEVAVDGCSVSVFGLPLSGMARAYAALAAARPGSGAREDALARIRDAMRAFPAAVGGAGRFSTVLMERAGRALVAKGGAEGLECVGWLGADLGLALKVQDGNARAAGPATVAALEARGALDDTERTALADQRAPVIVNHAGMDVGRIEPVLEVTAAVA